jgi:orotidine-5'-phosphate decarboxylase
LIPGVGAQKGDLTATLKAARGAPFLINASRSIVSASTGRDYADAAAEAAQRLHQEIQSVEETVVGS